MAEVYIYRPDCQDFSTIGECGRMDASLCDCEMVANGLIEITLEHPIDRLGRYRLLQENWILKTEIPVLTTPEIEGGAYVTSVERWTVSPGATKAQRTVWSKASGGRKKKVLKANSAVTVTSAPATGSRYKVKTGKVTGWMESAALVNKVTETIPATATGIEQAVPSWELREQTFRIYHVDQTDRKVTAYAKARSYDLAYNLTTYNTDGAVSLQAALDGIFGNTLDSHEAEAYTDISGTRVGVHARDMNPIQALLDPENGLCARWNAQLVRDEMDFFLLAHAGRDRGLRIEFARNLAGIHMSTNIDDVFTHVRPIGETKQGGPLYLESNQGLMACPKAASYPFKRIYPLKVSEAKVDKQVSTALARTRMTQAAQALIDTGIDEPDVDAKIAFERLGDSPRYQQYRALKDRAFLYDTIVIHHPVLGIDISAQVCRLKWDCLREKTKDMDIGSLAKLAPSVSSWQLSGNINGSKLADGTVGGVALVDGAVDVRHLQADSVNADAMQANSVTAGKVAAGAITTEKLSAGAVTADKLAANAVTAAKIDANSVSAAVVETDAFEAATADIAQAEIGSADIGFAQIKDANVEQLIARDAVTGRYYIQKLQVDNAQMVQATVGALVVRAGDGKYYRLDFDDEGNLTPTEVTLTQGEIAAGETADGRGSIIETDLTVQDLAAANMKAINALIDKITTKRLYATEAFIDELHTSMITDDDFVNIVVGVGNAQSAAEAAQATADGAATAASNAQSTANGAASAASAAQSAANGAASAAATAQSTADSAASAASAAQATANAKADPMTATAHGGEIAVSDSAEAAIGGLVIYGKSTQSGTPSPTAPALIYNAGAFTAKNMLPGLASETTIDGVKYTPQADGTVKAVGTSSGQHPLYLMQNVPWREGNYTLTGGSGLSATGVRITACVHGGSRGTKYYETYSSASATVIVYAGEQLDVYFRSNGGSVAINATLYPMLRYASVADDAFEPYDSRYPVGVPVGTQLPVVTTGENLISTNAELWESWASVVDYALDPETATVTVTARKTGDWPQAIVYIPCAQAFRGKRVTLRVDSVERSNSNHIWRVYLMSYNGSSESSLFGLGYSGSVPDSATVTVPDDCTRMRILFRIDQNRSHQVGDWTRFGGVSMMLADQYDGEVHPFRSAVTVALPTPNGLPGIAVSSGGNYTDENDQQWVCDTIDLAAGTYTKRCGTIPGYDGETIPGAYLSTTGGLTAGATIVYALATPVVTPLTEAQLTALRSIRTRDGTTVLTNDAGADMDLTYATRTGGGSYVEGVRQGLDDGIERAQGAADAAQVTADAAREDFRRVVRIDTEGLHVGDSQTSNEVMIDSESVNVVLGGRKYSKFAGDYVQFGDYQLRRSVDGGLVFKKA